MAFLDDVGRKISNWSQTAVQKTKGVADGARINSNISEEEKNLNNIYRDLGRTYYQIHANDPDPQLKNIVLAAVESEKKLSFLYQQLRDIQGLVRCPACGNMAPSNSMFCNACGSGLPKANQPMNGTQCPKCGNTLAMPTKFCNKCGFKIENVVPAPNIPIPAIQSVSPVNPVTPAMSVPAASNTNSCPKCGAPITGNLKFCTMCGEKLQLFSADANPLPTQPDSSSNNGTEKSPQIDMSGQPIPAVLPQTNETVTCKKCGAVIRDGLKFCTACGTKINNEAKSTFDSVSLDAKAESDLVKCKACGKSVKPGILYCTSCGALMTDNTSVTKGNDLNEPVSIEKKEPISENTTDKTDSTEDYSLEQDTIVCPGCGLTIKKGLKFCVICGYDLNNNDNSTPPQEEVSDKKELPIKEEKDEIKLQIENPKISLKLDIEKKHDKPDIQLKKDDTQKNSESDDLKCPTCGSQIRKGLKFCVSCGTKLSNKESEESVKPFSKVSEKEELPVPSEDDSQQTKIAAPEKPTDIPDFLPRKDEAKKKSDSDDMKCPTCGSKIRKGLKFCVSCGTRLSPTDMENPFLKSLEKANSSIPSEDDSQKTKMAVQEKLPDLNIEKKSDKPVFLSKKDDKKATPDSDNFKCPNCGSKTRKGLNFCVACGTRLSPADSAKAFSSAPAEVTKEDEKQENKAVDSGLNINNKDDLSKTSDSNKISCPNCGSQIKKGLKFCVSCGKKLSSNDDVKPFTSVSNNNDKSESEKPDFISNKNEISRPLDSDKTSCPNCGSQIKKGLKFCVSCGTKLSSNDEMQPFPAAPKKDNERRTIAAVPEMLLELDEKNNYDKSESEKSAFPTNKDEISKPLDSDKLSCPNCGSQVKKGLKFCVSCGTKLSLPKSSSNPPKQTDNDELKCPGCGSTVKKGLNFCVTCGFRLNSSGGLQSSQPPKTPENPNLSAPKQDLKNMFPQTPNVNNGNNGSSLCPSCGAAVRSGLKFCVSCGTRLIPPNSLRAPLPPMKSNESANAPSDDNDSDYKTRFADLETFNTPENSESSFGENDSALKNQSNGVITCSNCGSKVESNLKFCTVCGNKLSASDNKTNNSQSAFSSSSEQSKSSTSSYGFNSFDNANEINCPSCNAKISAGLKFCTVCGTKIDNQNNNSSGQQNMSSFANKKKCKKCGALEDASMLFCTSCGSSLSKEEEPFAKKSLNDNVPFGKKKCNNCGAVLDSDIRFCTSCGVPLAGDNNKTSAKSSVSYSMESSKTVFAAPVDANLDSYDSSYGNHQEKGSLPNNIPFSGLPFGVRNASGGKICPKCKIMMPDDMMFCTQCGTRL